MRINVGAKLWLAFFCTLTLTVLTMYLLLHSSLKRGFLDYTSQQSVQRLEILQGALVNIYKADGSFASLQQDPERWLEVKSIIFANTPPLPPNTTLYVDEQQSTQKYYREFVNSVSLFDHDRNLLMGVIKPGNIISWIPLRNQAEVIGFIGFVKPKVVVREADRKFMTHQLTVFGIISVVILTISIAVATFMTRRISRPIKELSLRTEALAAGDYEQRLKINSHDEIGQLCSNFNTLAQTLAANEKSRANWIADISHEMRTPIAVLKAQIEAMQDGIRPLDSANLALLAKNISGLNGIVNDLFELTLSDIGALSYQKQDLAFGNMVGTCVEQFQAKAVEAGLTLKSLRAAKDSIKVFGDAKRLEQLLCNLLENSIRYTDSEGTIEVELIDSSDKITLIIRDSAPTVIPEQRKRIFERLHRLENSRNRNTGGAGLGLAICANIVAAHQGTIRAEDSPLGGLSMRIVLPKKPR